MTTTTEPSFETSMEAFFSHVRTKLDGEASAKGYARQGNGRALIDSVSEECGEGHALGEIRYKLIRWRARRDPSDLAKVAAWAFLEWDRHQRNVGSRAEVPTFRHAVCPVCGLLRGRGVQTPVLTKGGNGHALEACPENPEAQADGHP